MASDHHSASQRGIAPRYRNISGRPLNRRAVLKAAAGLSATLAAGTAATVAPVRQPVATAQEVDGVRAREWVEAEQLGVSGVDEGDGWVSFEAEFPFWAVGVGWDAEVGSWPVVELQVSPDGVTYEDIVNLTMRDDGGPSPKDGRVYSDLYFTNGETFIRYRTTDGERNLVDLDRFLITYIDPTDGPWDEDRPQMVMRTASITAQSEDTDVPPSIITRAQWGANENLRFEDGMEIWPPEYAPVEHAIVHHAAVNYGSDGYNAVRSIYYYHAVTQGWGDIGYNYVVDVKGNIFEGRVGGANVIGGHAYEYAVGSSGICVMGDFSYTDAPQAAKASLAYILAYVTRDLDTYATKPFHEAPDLPTICGHRDVVESECPGDYLYDDLPWLRDTVAATLDAGMLDTGNPGGIVPGDRVKVVTEDGGPLNIRQGAGLASSVIGSVENGSYLLVRKGPISDADFNWYEVTDDANTDNVDTSSIIGWVAADFLVVDPPELDLPPDAYAFGMNIQVSGSAYLRSKPSTSGSVVATASNGTWGFIMAGPVDANGYRWYQVRVEGISSDGWMATEGFKIAPVYNPTPKFAVGSQVEATASAAIRVRPGIVQTASGQAACRRALRRLQRADRRDRPHLVRRLQRLLRRWLDRGDPDQGRVDHAAVTRWAGHGRERHVPRHRDAEHALRRRHLERPRRDPSGRGDRYCYRRSDQRVRLQLVAGPHQLRQWLGGDELDREDRHLGLDSAADWQIQGERHLPHVGRGEHAYRRGHQQRHHHDITDQRQRYRDRWPADGFRLYVVERPHELR